jgi:hypothetical protein
MEKINPELIIQYLNSLLLLDQKAISELVEKRVEVNEQFSHHETVQILRSGSDDKPIYSVGLLGILNGLCGVDDDGWGFVVAECNSQGLINKFIHKKDRNK